MYVPFSFFQMLSYMFLDLISSMAFHILSFYLCILDFISSMAFHILSTVSAVW
jgi:hypothetical protein